MSSVKTLEDLDKLLDRIHIAQNKFATFSEEKVDAIFKAATTAANKIRIDLAEMAVEEIRLQQSFILF